MWLHQDFGNKEGALTATRNHTRLGDGLQAVWMQDLTKLSAGYMSTQMHNWVAGFEGISSPCDRKMKVFLH